MVHWRKNIAPYKIYKASHPLPRFSLCKLPLSSAIDLVLDQHQWGCGPLPCAGAVQDIPKSGGTWWNHNQVLDLYGSLQFSMWVAIGGMGFLGFKILTVISPVYGGTERSFSLMNAARQHGAGCTRPPRRNSINGERQLVMWCRYFFRECIQLCRI